MIRFVSALALLLALACLGVRGPAQSPAPAPESPRAAKIHADLQEILRTGGYQGQKTEDGFLTKIGTWIGEQWSRFTSWLRRFFRIGGRIGGVAATPILPYVLLVALILLIAYAIAYAVKNYKRNPASSHKKPSVDTVIEPEESAAAEPDAWIAAARRHADAGDFRRAYRAVFLAILIRLDRRGAIRFERSKTNGDYIRALRGAPDLLGFLRPLANEFDARWYGRAETNEIDFRRLLDQYDAVPGKTG